MIGKSTGEVMSSSANVGRGREDEGGVELVNIRVLPTDNTETDGKINEGFHTENEIEELASTVHSAKQQTVDLTSSFQVISAVSIYTYYVYSP